MVYSASVWFQRSLFILLFNDNLNYWNNKVIQPIDMTNENLSNLFAYHISFKKETNT